MQLAFASPWIQAVADEAGASPLAEGQATSKAPH